MAHHHEEHFAGSSRALKVTLAIVVGILLTEIIGGIASNSLALLSDAGHMFVDALALGLSLFAITLAARPVSATKTYGYHRAEIMAALANGTTLVLVAVFIYYEAYQRFLNPPEVRTPIMLAVALVGLVANFIGIVLLRRASLGSLNIKAAFWHVVGDTISSVGVVAGAIVIALTGWSVVDPIIAVLIGTIILWGAVQIVRESTDILLEAVPRHISIEQAISSIKAVAGVVDVHDVHIWTITSGMYAMSGHLVVNDQMVSRGTDIVKLVTEHLAEKYNIRHTTLQIECDSCPSGLVCNISRFVEHER